MGTTFFHARFAVLLRLLFIFPVLCSPAGVMDRWTTNQVSTNWFGLNSIVYGNGRYVAYGSWSDWGILMSSEDGLNWVLRLDGNSPAGNGFSYAVSLRYAQGRFFAFGGFGVSATSGDGIYWTTFSFPAARGVAYGAGKYIAAANDPYRPNGVGVYASIDGLYWGRAGTLAASLGDIAYGAGLFVAIGVDNGFTNNSGHIYTSGQGTNWTERAIAGGNTIRFCNGIFIVPYVNGTNLLSANGINWAAESTGIPYRLDQVIYDHGAFLGTAYGYLAASTNGTNWFIYSKPLPAYAGAVASDGVRLVTGSAKYTSTSRYDGFAYYSDPLIELGITNATAPRIVLSGLVGRNYRIEWTDSLVNGPVQNWQTAATLQLPSDPLLWVDSTAANSPHRYYRAVLLP